MSQKKSPAPKKVVVPVSIYSPKGLGRRVVALPAVVHLLMAFFIGLEADSSGVVLMGVIFGAGFTGLFLASMGYEALTTAVGAAWLPMLFTWRHWYWGMDMHSPGGASQNMVAALGWKSSHAALAVGAVCAACGVVGWVVVRLTRWNEQRTAKKR
jgi:hypothetical protein